MSSKAVLLLTPSAKNLLPVQKLNLLSLCSHHTTCINSMKISRFTLVSSFNTKSQTLRQYECPSILQTHSVICCQKRYKGHSHFQNIKATKESKDNARSKDIAMLAQRAKVAITDNGSADPYVNTELAKVIEMGKQKNIPNDTIQKIIATVVSKNENSKEEIVEGSGVGGLMLVIKTYTASSKQTKMQIQSKMKWFGANVGASGSVMHSFQQKGYVEVELGKTDSREHDQHIELALEVEADDVTMETRDGVDYLEFECDPKTVSQVKRKLLAKDMNVTFSDAVFEPLTKIQLTEESKALLEKMLNKLKDIEEVEDIFTNVDMGS